MNRNSITHALLHLVMIVIALSLSLSSANATLQVQRVPTVYVVDQNTNTPIEGASVYLDDAFKGRTDSFGALSLRTLSAGTYRLNISKEGYTAYEATINTLLSPVIFAPVARSGATPLFRTDFEDVTKVDSIHSSISISHGFNFQGDGGAAFWMEGLDRKTPGITCHSGSRCVGMELTDITKSRRNEFNIGDLNALVGDELFVSVWLYLPADWQLHGPIDQWYSLFVPFEAEHSPYYPSVAMHIAQVPPSPEFWMLTDYYAYDGSYTSLAYYENFPLPRGRWFQCQYYVKHSPTDGALKVWVDGILIIDKSGFATAHSNEEWLTSIAKIYYNDRDTFSPYRIWVDDLQIYNKIP